MADEIMIPEVPPVPNLPEAVKNAWRKTYAQAFKQAVMDHPNEPSHQVQAALREANRIFRVKEPSDYADAVDLKDWQVIRREERDGELKVVTIDGKKFSFPVPKTAAPVVAEKGAEAKR